MKTCNDDYEITNNVVFPYIHQGNSPFPIQELSHKFTDIY